MADARQTFRASPADPDPTAAPPLVVDARRLAAILCLSIRSVRTLDAAGKLPSPLRIGGRVVWRLDELKAWLTAGAPDRKTWAVIRAARK